MRRRLVLSTIVLFGGCGPFASHNSPAPASAAWATAIGQARSAVDSGRYAQADSILAAYAGAYPQSGEAREAEFFRAFFKADPSNKEGSSREALALINAYLAYGTGQPRYTEARILRRTLELVETLRDAAGGARATANGNGSNGNSTPAISEGRDRPRDEMILQLQQELAKTKEELERIKRRVRGTKPGTDTIPRPY